MYKIIPSKQFKKDFKKLARSGRFDVPLFNAVVNALAKGEPLGKKYKDHELQGALEGHRECHLKPDLLLIYAIEKNRLILQLFRVGSHSELLE